MRSNGMAADDHASTLRVGGYLPLNSCIARQPKAKGRSS